MKESEGESVEMFWESVKVKWSREGFGELVSRREKEKEREEKSRAEQALGRERKSSEDCTQPQVV